MNTCEYCVDEQIEPPADGDWMVILDEAGEERKVCWCGYHAQDEDILMIY